MNPTAPPLHRADHWVVRMNHRNRAGSFVLVFAAVGSHLLDTAQPGWVWVLAVLHYLVLPHLMHWRARRAPDPVRTELHNLLADAALFGLWVGALGFPLWISFSLIIATTVNMTVFRNTPGALKALASVGAGIVIGWTLAGWPWHPATGALTTALSITCISLYLLVVAQGAYARALRLHETRNQLRQGEQALQEANAALQRQILENETLQAQLREQAERDPLTGLYNRRYLAATLERELARCRRESGTLSVMLLDIDHFKRINDSHGHQVGDDFLLALAHVLTSQARASDVVCRYGGEEFLLVLPHMPLEVAIERADELRETFARTTLQGAGGLALQATISVGIANYPEHGVTADELVYRADMALYRAKADGRHCVRVADAGRLAPALATTP